MIKNGTPTLAGWIVLLTMPLFVSSVAYVLCDPFSVLHHEIYGANNPVAINRDFGSTELYLRGRAANHYDSFIFGNSRSFAFLCNDWTGVLGRPDASCFHFDASKESIFGVEAKVRLVDETSHAFRDALIVLDGSLLSETRPSEGPAFRKHPRLTGQSWIGFQFDYLADFYSNHFCIKYFDYALFGRVRGYMGPVFDELGFTHLLETNDVLFTSTEQKIAHEGEGFWVNRPQVFGPRTGGIADVGILEEQRRLLQSMASVFRRRGTVLRVVVSPHYDQIQMNPDDVATLRQLVGPDNVFDFSGVNQFTTDVHNYYEDSHYRPPVARAILTQLYPGADRVAH